MIDVYACVIYNDPNVDYFERAREGACFSLPFKEETIKERFGFDTKLEYFFVEESDLDVPFNVYTIEEVNQVFYDLEQLDKEIFDNMRLFYTEGWITSVADLVKQAENFRFYSGINSFEEYARFCVDSGKYELVDEQIKKQVDFKALGKEIEIKGSFVQSKNGLFEYIG